MTTTKRDLDASSDVWLATYVRMKKALRVWVNYTNAWKNHPRSDQTPFWADARPVSIREAVRSVAVRFGYDEKADFEVNPKKFDLLPDPPEKKPSSRRVVFSRPLEEIRAVSDALFDRPDERPGVVGDACFERVLEEVSDRGAGRG